MGRCVRCKSLNISMQFDIKHGLHDWFLCFGCSDSFFNWVVSENANNGCLWSKKYCDELKILDVVLCPKKKFNLLRGQKNDKCN